MIKRDYRRGCFVKGLVFFGVVGFSSFAWCIGASTGARGQEIRVKFLDARTGRPVTYEAAQIWVGTGTGAGPLLAPAKNKEGTATFLYTGHSIRAIWPPNTKLRHNARELTMPLGPGRIAAAPTVAAGMCWDLGPLRLGPWYPISEILQHGAVSENHCGKATATAKPGELILFIKPLSFWRRLIDGFRS